jgi:hypothetical protein
MAKPQHRPRKTWSPRERRRLRGAAYTETVVMLPFFIAVWTCMLYVHKAYSIKVSTMAQNRNCVFAYAYEACTSAPAGCNPTTGAGSDSGDSPGVLSSFTGILGSIGGTLFSSIFGQNATEQTTNNIPKPALLGGGTTTALAGNNVMCNTQRTTPADVATEAFCSLTHLC